MASLRNRFYPSISSIETAKGAVRGAWGSWLPLLGAGALSLVFLSESDSVWLGLILLGLTATLAIVQFFFQFRFQKWAALASFFVMAAFLVRSIQMTISNGFAAHSPLGFALIQGGLLLALMSIWNGVRGTKFIGDETPRTSTNPP